MLVLGMDPGQLSGLVIASVGGRTVLDVSQWAENDQRDTVEWVSQALGAGVQGVVCETFKPRMGRAIAFKPYSLELIGWVRGQCWQLGLPLWLQDPYVKEHYHAQALEQFPAVGRGGGGHARDALAHVIGWAQTRMVPVS